jgi:phosphatidate cytidylyltransferase
MSSTRVITGAVLIPLLLAVVWFLPHIYFRGLIAFAAAVGRQDFYRMAWSGGARPLAPLGMVLGSVLVMGDFYGTRILPGEGLAAYAALCIIAVLTARLFSSQPVGGAFNDIAVTVTGIFYVALLFGFQPAIHAGFRGKQWLLFLYLVIWASDTGAYYVGTAFGRHRLYEKISPKKSIEGLLGGTAAAMVAALLCSFWVVRVLGAVEAVVLGAVLALVGTAGDLAESLIKRSAGVKDSGSIMPGHGGILDRMDSLMFAAPVLYFYLRMR